MYYLKYRPKQLAQLDNSKVKDSILSILSTKNIPHAFLFVGKKGTGKTSVARIIAKSLNCLNNKFAGKSDSIEPCNNCSNCILIDKDASPDVLELDAASNRGIEEIRNLIKESFFSPMHSRYRVFIIDEAHMITQDAFNVLLKTLEEPPSNVIFILATTNPEKIPETIKSRCMTVSFSPVDEKDIVNMLKRICQGEELAIDEKVLSEIAKASGKSFRDAAKLLEELVMVNKTSYEEAIEYLGIKSDKHFLDLLLKNKIKEAVDWVDKFYLEGGDIKALITETLNELKDKLITAVNQDNKSEIKKLSLLIKLFQEAYQQLRSSPIEVIPVELALVSFYNKMKHDKSV